MRVTPGTSHKIQNFENSERANSHHDCVGLGPRDAGCVPVQRGNSVESQSESVGAAIPHGGSAAKPRSLTPRGLSEMSRGCAKRHPRLISSAPSGQARDGYRGQPRGRFCADVDEAGLGWNLALLGRGFWILRTGVVEGRPAVGYGGSWPRGTNLKICPGKISGDAQVGKPMPRTRQPGGCRHERARPFRPPPSPLPQSTGFC
jgi:hypothetical protein